eukprot:8334655-Ditylum_brightwellii.AAC.1
MMNLGCIGSHCPFEVNGSLSNGAAVGCAEIVGANDNEGNCDKDGCADGIAETEGTKLGWSDGILDGVSDGALDSVGDKETDGLCDTVGESDGAPDGDTVGADDTVGAFVGETDGTFVGELDGSGVTELCDRCLPPLCLQSIQSSQKPPPTGVESDSSVVEPDASGAGF